MKTSDIFDIPLVLIDDGKYYELEFDDYTLDGLTELPIICYLRKGDRIYKKYVRDYNGTNNQSKK